MARTGAVFRAGCSALKDGFKSKDQALINNRQAGRRNRGRNNGRQNGGNRGENGNRIDNRARGNAPQLLEKYRNLARDAQLAGDRVNTEYYLQFADHYFRVIADNRARQEEHQSRFRRNDDNLDDDFDQDEAASGDNQQDAIADDGRFNRNRDGRHQHRRRDEQQPVRLEVNEGARREAVETESEAQESAVADETTAPKRRGRKPREHSTVQDEAHPGLDLSVLPPAIARADNDSDEAEAAAPRRRGRRPRAAAEAAE